MKYVTLGKSGLKVSQVGFGGIPIASVSFEEAERCIRTSLDLGINFIDTARAYKDSEEKIGRALKNLKSERENLVIATKAIPKSLPEVIHSLEESLRRLHTDYIDLLQMHNAADQAKLDRSLEILEGLLPLKEEGKIRHIGVSVHGVEWANRVIETDAFETIMIAMNFIVREPVDVILPVAREHNTGVIVMKPMAGGEITNPRLAFKFFLEMDDVAPIVGIKSPEEIREIMKIIEDGTPPTKEEKEEMDRIRRETGNVFCRRCGYCEPCPQGVDIVSINVFPSIIKRYPPLYMLQQGMDKSLKSYEKCIKCGECEEKCPYRLHIREMMEKSYRTYLEITGAR
ncbi:aldo/keto reductase [Candidatus Sumerlaeota bacterium]|nr:aldo/keto reductase [Candidatus Sumerlaeota bacterium]